MERLSLLQIFALLIVWGGFALFASASSCTFTGPSNNVYNWQSTLSGADLSPSPDGTGQIYFFSPCANSLHCNNASEGASPSPLCNLDTNGLYHGCGQLSNATYTELSVPGTGFVATFQNGDPLKSGTRQTTVYCLCRSQGPTIRPYGNTYESPVGHYNLVYEDPSCCPLPQ